MRLRAVDSASSTISPKATVGGTIAEADRLKWVCSSSSSAHRWAAYRGPYVEARLFSPRELVVDAPRSAMDLMERLLVSFVPPEIDVLAESGVVI